MKRNAVALAVGAAFVAPAAQAQIVFGNETIGTMQIYGKLYPQFLVSGSKDPTLPGDTVSTLVSTTGICGTAATAGSCSTSTPGSRRAVDVQNSYLGFRGERDLRSVGFGLKAIWQIEQSLNFDSGNGQWSSRDSFLGLASNFGTVKLGFMDTTYKQYGDTFSMFGISSGNFVSASNVLSHIGIGNNNNARFHERKANSLQYETPSLSGFQAGLTYSPDESRDTQNLAGNGLDKTLYSYGVKYDSKMFYVSVHGERHNDFFGGSSNVGASGLSNIGTLGAHSKDTAMRVSGEFRYSENGRVTLDLSRLKYVERGQAAGVHFQEYKHNTWALGWDFGFGGPWRFATQYVRGNEGSCSLTGGAACSTDGLTGYEINFGVRYRWDRQTFWYAIAGKLVNGKSARYDNWSPADPARGADITQAALGVSYSF